MRVVECSDGELELVGEAHDASKVDSLVDMDVDLSESQVKSA